VSAHDELGCADGMHKHVVYDKFARIPGVFRIVPGDCFCLDCKQPIAAWWNHGEPIIATDKKERPR
jgi:hypothetical protein